MCFNSFMGMFLSLMWLFMRFSECKYVSVLYEVGIDMTALRFASTISSSSFVSNAGKRLSLLVMSDMCLSLGSFWKKLL